MSGVYLFWTLYMTTLLALAGAWLIADALAYVREWYGRRW